MDTNVTVRHSTQKISHARKDKIFINSIVDKCSIYSNCLKLCSLTVICAWQSWLVKRVAHQISKDAHVQQLWIFGQRDFLGVAEMWNLNPPHPKSVIQVIAHNIAEM